MDGGDGERGRCERSQQRVRHLVPDEGRGHRAQRIDVDQLAALDAKPGGRVHPRIGQRDEDCRGRAAERDDGAGQQVLLRSHAFPTI